MLQTPSLSLTTPPSAAGLIEAKGQKSAEFSQFSVFLDLDAVARRGAEAGETASAETDRLSLDIAAQLPEPGNTDGKILPVSVQTPATLPDAPETDASGTDVAAVDLTGSGTASLVGNLIGGARENAAQQTIGFTQGIAPDLPGTDLSARTQGNSERALPIMQGPLPEQQEQTQALAGTTALRTLSAVETAKSGQIAVGNSVLVRSADAANSPPLEATSVRREGAPKGLSVTIVAETAMAAAHATHTILAGATATPHASLARPPVQSPGAADQTASSPTAAEPQLAKAEGNAGTDALRGKTADASIAGREAVQTQTHTPRPVVMDARTEVIVVEARSQSSAPTNTIASTAARAQYEMPLEFGALVERLAEAREAAAPHAVRTAVRHVEFGVVNLQFRADDAQLNVTMNSADPDFAPAVQAASAGAQSGSASDSGTRQDVQTQAQTQGRQSDTASQSPHNPSQSNADKGGREDDRPQLSRNPSVASGAGETGHEADSNSAPGGGIYA